MSDYELSDAEDDTFYDEDEEMDAQDEGKCLVFNSDTVAMTTSRFLSFRGGR